MMLIHSIFCLKHIHLNELRKFTNIFGLDQNDVN